VGPVHAGLESQERGHGRHRPQNAVGWLGSLLQPENNQAAYYEGLEYVKWAGLDIDQYNFLYNTNAGSAVLTQFLSQPPEPYAQTGTDGPGYCNYQPPSPDQSDYSSAPDEVCGGHCTSVLGCTPVFATQTEPEEWGSADEAAQLDQEIPTTDFGWKANEAATGMMRPPLHVGVRDVPRHGSHIC
jgi:hypothetical protein